MSKREEKKSFVYTVHVRVEYKLHGGVVMSPTLPQFSEYNPVDLCVEASSATPQYELWYIKVY